MFENLSERLGGVFERLTRQGALSEADVETALREVREWAGLAASVPLFDSVLVYSPQRLEALLRSRDPAWTTREVRLLEEGDVPLTLAIYGQDRLEIEVEFDPAQIDPAKAERIADHYLRLLGAMAQARPEAGLGTLGMLDAEEIAQLRHLGQPDLPLGEQVPCPVTRFEAQARATPDAVAVQDSDGILLTFAQLDRQANALAWRLIAQGAGLGQIVAINLPRCADFIVSALAVLKTGGAFLPLDTALPETERCLRAVEAGVSAIIGQNGLAGLAVPLLRPDRSERHDTLPRPPMRADRLAYIIHTSGSTGRPKGVMGTTGALSAHASAMIALFDLGPADRVLHFASPGFDVALEEIVPSLLAGASVVIRGEDEITSVQAFLDFLRDRQVTVMNLPASFWHVLVEEMVARGLSLPGAGAVAAVYGLTWGVAQIGTGRLSDRIGRQVPNVGGMALCGIGVMLFPLMSGAAGYGVAAAITGLGMALLYPNLSAAVADIAPPDRRGATIGLYRFWRDLGYAVGALAFGLVAQGAGRAEPAFWFTGAAMLVSAAVLWRWGAESLPRRQP